MTRSRIVLLGLIGLWACGGDPNSDLTDPGTRSNPPEQPPPTGGSGLRIVFQHPGNGPPEFNVGPFEDNVPVGPGLRYLVRAVPTDVAGNAVTNQTLNWSISGGGSLDHAVTAPTGGNDATLNGLTTGTQDGVESITVALPAYPGVQGVLRVRVVHLQLVAVSPSNANPLTLGLGQQIPLTAQLQTANGQPFVWSITFNALLDPDYPCSHYELTGGLGTTPGAKPVEELTVPTDAQGKATVIYTAPTASFGACQGFVGAAPAKSPSGIGGQSSEVFGVSWLASLTPTPASKVLAVSGDVQAASPGATLGQPLIVEVEDAFGNGVGGVTVNWSTSSGFVSPTSLTTDAGGRVSAKWTVGAAAGAQTLTASIPGGASVIFTASVS
ncbi:MAG TPA: Ig-like domain-containing protein [Gemmatimonadales bacterium]|nr:Ig-like domain-containing protein [Gemmatimonadales bacterium]